VGNRIQILFGVMSNLSPMVQAGKMKVLAINGDSRYKKMPEVKTIAETVPGYQRPPSWIGIFGPHGLPGAIVTRLSDEIVKAGNDAGVKARIEKSGTVLDPLPADKFASIVTQDMALAARLMPQLHIRKQ
jgi:tripartite-type tricarboxylate transporter receptor subunit TctC